MFAREPEPIVLTLDATEAPRSRTFPSDVIASVSKKKLASFESTEMTKFFAYFIVDI